MIATCAALIAGAAHLFFGSIIFASSTEELQSIVLRDKYEHETHELSGIAMVPSDCHELSVRSRDLDARTIVLVLETWEQPSRSDCSKTSAPRAIRAVVYAPKEVRFRALFDSEWVLLKIVNVAP